MLPNLIIIGAQKCATTSLHYYLNFHPQISMSREKELDFFIQERNWRKGIEWYKSNFKGEEKIHGESSPNYTKYPLYDGVPARIHSIVPEVKLIYILRDPIERIVSSYIHNYSSGTENREISEALSDMDFNNTYICRSKYFMQLKQYLQFFPYSNIMIITREELFNDRRRTLNKIFRFLNIDGSFSTKKFSYIKHPSRWKRRKNRAGIFLEQTIGKNIIRHLPPEIRGKAETLLYFPFSHRVTPPTLNEQLRKMIADTIKEDINSLREFTQNDFESWSV